MSSKIARCIYCNRKLKSKKSQERGYGLICYQKHLLNKNYSYPLFNIEKKPIDNNIINRE